MQLRLLPTDVLELIESHLIDLRAWRIVHALPWTPSRSRRQACGMLSGQRRRPRATCAHCPHQVLTELIWSNHRIEWVPYCALHARPWLLDDVHVYCVGGVDVNGRSLLYS